MKSKLSLSYLLLLLVFSFPLNAFAKPNISLLLDSKKVLVDKNTKKETFSEAKDVKPGDVIQYKIKVSNTGDTAALEVQPVGNIPEKTIYMPVIKQKYKTFFSIDKGATFQAKPKISLREKGKDVIKDAPIDLYNKIQWIIDKVDPSETIEVIYKVKVK